MITAPVIAPTRCPACEGAMVDLVYEQAGVPVSSNRLFTSRAEARACARGDIRLAFCHACGLIANVEFDPQSVSEDVETSQAASPRFRDYATSLASRWIEAYDLRGRTVLEIGCGRGEFLEWMCDLGVGRAIGVDPVLADAAAGGDEEPARPIEWIPEHFRAEHLAPDVRAIVCRHTLEHVYDVGRFVADLADSVRGRDVVVLVEVPDVLPILEHAAFWDIYYEHCTYFSAGSLSRLFTEAGFEVLRVDHAYDGQYLVLEAKPAKDGRAAPVARRDDRPGLWYATSGFRLSRRRHQEELARLFSSFESRGQRVALWGAGSKATALLTGLHLGDGVQCVVDINPRKQGTFIAGTGHPVVAPEALREYRPDVVVLMNEIYRDEVATKLRALGVEAQLIGTRTR